VERELQGQSPGLARATPRHHASTNYVKTQLRDLFIIDTDAHSPTGFGQLHYGLDEARRGWLEKGEVLNARGLDGFLEARGNRQ
jgi:histidinol phosphatase-like PHP family hydrolase